MVIDIVAEDIELIKFDDSIQLKSESGKDNMIILISEDGEESKELSNSSSTEFPEVIQVKIKKINKLDDVL
uniref:Uncharacterized protein n=1 Tax=Tetranychus urticae TaxID=32264 RepID=T1KUB5_TETUR